VIIICIERFEERKKLTHKDFLFFLTNLNWKKRNNISEFLQIETEKEKAKL